MIEAATKTERKRSILSVVGFLLLAFAVVFGTFKVLMPFITSIILALVIVIATFRLYRRLRIRLNGRNHLAAILMLLGITVTIFLPATILGFMLVEQASHLMETMQNTDVNALTRDLQLNSRLGWVKRFAPGFDPSRIQIEAMLINLVRRIPGLVAAYGGAVLARFANLLLGFVMMLLAAYYFYVDGEKLARELKYLSPLPDRFDRQIFARLRGVVNATFRGQFLTAFAQGAVTGIGLAIAGVPGPIFWGAIAALFGVLPMVGAAAVWVPASAYLLMAAAIGKLAWWKGIFLVLWGVLVVSLVDNLVRPWAMKGDTNMPAVLLLFSILGGIQAFGFTGILIGPLLFALLITVVDMYKLFFADALRTQNDAGAQGEVEV